MDAALIEVNKASGYYIECIVRPIQAKCYLHAAVMSRSLSLLISMHNRAKSIVDNHCDALFGHLANK